MGYASVLLQSSHPLEIACKGFLELPRAERCFLLDSDGRQIGANINSPHAQVVSDPRFAPLRDAAGGTGRAGTISAAPSHARTRVQVTRPYLSAATATPCITISIASRSAASVAYCAATSADEAHGSH
ncbi:MAG: hypothetical protein IPK65_06550 [Gammaproteobacteria bacterium]|nr:hypothetical protein [Gammaproteobacteria bacterium]